ncbi:hypothetical protein B5K05_28480 [Rhizobium phaseoli]|nr:multicopper oxidase domain-containing protein [Rhizobium phaseoli]PDS69609.1 hypothetical protein CO651_22775 [Rhizobium phaseoli]RDJ03697.1 hypothetical protein B5K05_28480 [Rhizobium phaseoli]
MSVSDKIAIFGMASVFSVTHALFAVAQEARAVTNPLAYMLQPITKSQGMLKTFEQSRETFPGEVLLDMNATYLDRQIYNPATARYYHVKLRGYQDARQTGLSGADTPLVGPTIDVRPGQTVRVTLHNLFPQDSTCGIGGGSANTPHFNPFQIIKIVDAAGNDVSALGADDDGDPQYPGLKNVWKDTLWIKNPGTDPSARYTITVRTHYQRYIGEFVLHCHILDHEDQGMMQNIRITLPDGQGGTVSGHY